MPGYTILIMKRNATDRRPFTLHLAGWFIWLCLFLAVALPVGGFLVSAGFLAPAWLKLNVKNMQHQVEEAEKIKEESVSALEDVERIKGQLDQERKLRAEAEAKFTMAETARNEATTKLTEVEVEAVALKRSVATYEQMLKPKLARELVQCVNFEVEQTKPGTVAYGVSFAKLTKSEALPKLSVRIRVVAGDNAVALDENAGGGKTINIPLEKDLRVKGEMAVNLPADSTRLIDVKALDESGKPVGYCWKTF